MFVLSYHLMVDIMRSDGHLKQRSLPERMMSWELAGDSSTIDTMQSRQHQDTVLSIAYAHAPIPTSIVVFPAR